MNLLNLPLELILRMTDWLEPEEIFHLSLASKAFAYLIRYGTLCKRVLLVRTPRGLDISAASIPLISLAMSDI